MKNNTKNIRKGITATLFAMVMIASVLAVPASASISPERVEAELSPCESITVVKEVYIELPEKADVIFAFDLTASMGGIIETAKDEAQAIMDCVDALGVDVNYGVMSYMDYPLSYDYCDYSATYGSNGDYAYKLDRPLTSNQGDVVAAIEALTLGSGADGPQDYTRIMYESYADPNVVWRLGAKRILVNFGDNVPHDCNLNEGVTGGTWTTGGDPGRNEIMGTADDLDLQTVLAAMNDAGVTLLECHTADWTTPSGLPVFDYWDYWTGITGGGVYLTTSGTLVDDVCAAIEEGLTPPIVYVVHLQASAGYEDWLESEPASYDELETPVTVYFDETIHVPLGTECGVYEFIVSAMDIEGVNYGDQTVIIGVPCHVDVDIKPGSCPNPLNKKSKGVLPVAVLGTEDFDVTTIDPDKIELTREDVEEGVAPIRWSYEDVATPFEGELLCDCHDLNGDGYMDLTLKFDIQELVETLVLCPLDGQTIPLTITGNLKEEEGGTPIEGEDCIWVLKPGKSDG